MKYYVVKPKSAPVQDAIYEGVHSLDADAIFVDAPEQCDIAILQKGWTRSETAVKEREYIIHQLKKRCQEAYLYTDKYIVHTNSDHDFQR